MSAIAWARIVLALLFKELKPLRRREIGGLQHVLRGHSFKENRVQPPFDKRHETCAVLRERLGKTLRRKLISHAAYFTISSSE